MKITINGYIIGYHFDNMAEGAVVWAFNDYGQITEDDRVVHTQQHSFEVEVPDNINIVAAQVSALETAKIKALADYQSAVARINDRLSKLQALTCNAAAEVVEG